MGALRDYFAAIGRTIVTLGDGLAVTFSYLLRKPCTIQYPDRTPEPVVSMLPERSRGFLEADVEVCTGCKLCESACPIDCIHVEIAKDESGQRMIQRFEIDLSKCMFCGLCVEACPAGGLRHSHEFEGGMGDVRHLYVSFLDEPVPPAKKGKTVEPKPLGSIIRARLARPFDPYRGDRPASGARAPLSRGGEP
ncbi:MAG: NADH-quinone oxidoreductase subunit I [Deltaproteobacteria bacterium]|nr:NADH-quinone oxidoreductase subunit I [Deltaproteobacteria bacterium]